MNPSSTSSPISRVNHAEHGKLFRAVTLIELVFVIAIMVFLMAAMFPMLNRARTGAQVRRTQAVIEKIRNGLGAYNLEFRTYPKSAHTPPVSGILPSSELLENNQELYAWLTTPFRVAPKAGTDEVWASVDAGPFCTFETNELRTISGKTTIYDSWNSPLSFNCSTVNVPDPVQIGVTRKILVPHVHSFGINRINEGGAGDDVVGK